jgi:hypothetical protein
VMAGVAALVGGVLARLAFERARPAPLGASARPA